MNNIVTAKTKWMGVALVLVIALAAGLRLFHLGDTAFRADTILFFDLCHRPLSAWIIFADWIQLLGRTAQFPFALAFTKACLDLFHLPVSDFTIRLPMALFGIATIPAAIMAGALLGGKRFGLFVGLLLALNPVHIQMSREAYFYPPVLLGSALMLWSALWIFRRRHCSAPLPIRWYLATALGFFLLTYSHLSGWWLACLIVPFTMCMVIWRVKKGRGRPSEIAVLSVIYLLIGIPLLAFPWAVPYFVYDMMHPEMKANTIRILGVNTYSLWTMISSTGTAMAWGNTVFRTAFTFVVVALTMGALLFRSRLGGDWIRWNRSVLLLLGLLLAADILYYLGLFLTANQFAVRYQSFLLPLYLMLLAYGIWHAGSLWRGMRRLKPTLRRAPAYALAAVAVALNVQPAWFCTQLTGNPAPFKEVARWCDTQLPPHNLVLVERWFDPWNELRVHNSTNVYFTFTVPAEPPDVFERNNWPVTAKQFFNHFPDAAYLEYANSGRNRMGVVSNVYFARQVTFTNAAGIKLAKWGVAYREEFYDPATNRLITTIFYNTREDVIRHAREQGQGTLVLYEPSWGYVKLWQQLRDFRDWRILEDKAALEVYNLTSSTNRVTLKIRGMAMNGMKRISAAGGYHDLSRFIHDFRHLQLEEWELKDILLKPGLNKIVFSDSLWSVSKIPLLVDQIEVLFPAKYAE